MAGKFLVEGWILSFSGVAQGERYQAGVRTLMSLRLSTTVLELSQAIARCVLFVPMHQRAFLRNLVFLGSVGEVVERAPLKNLRLEKLARNNWK